MKHQWAAGSGLSTVCTVCGRKKTLAASMVAMVDHGDADEGCSGHRLVGLSEWLPEAMKKATAVACECGVDKTGGGIHSSWCPKATP